jgi:hypothetical protein
MIAASKYCFREPGLDPIRIMGSEPVVLSEIETVCPGNGVLVVSGETGFKDRLSDGNAIYYGLAVKEGGRYWFSDKSFQQVAIPAGEFMLPSTTVCASRTDWCTAGDTVSYALIALSEGGACAHQSRLMITFHEMSRGRLFLSSMGVF